MTDSKKDEYKGMHIQAGIAGIQATWMCRACHPLALDARFPAGMTGYLDNCV